MATDSTTAGYLSPTDVSPPIDDAALDAALQQIIVGVTSMAGQWVRPRWQPTPPQQPPASQDWCAVGVVGEDADENPRFIHHGDSEGYDVMNRTETLEIMASFYGPIARTNCKLLRDGLYLSQNRDAIRAAGFEMQSVERVVVAPELVNTQWIPRVDLTFHLSRMITRSYPIKNIASASGSIVSQDRAAEPWAVTAPEGT